MSTVANLSVIYHSILKIANCLYAIFKLVFVRIIASPCKIYTG